MVHPCLCCSPANAAEAHSLLFAALLAMFRLALQQQGAGEVFDLDDVPGRSHIDSFPVLAAAPPNIIDLTEAEMPAARAGRSRQRWCAGRAGSVCRFAADGSGGQARGKHGGQCVFCSDAGMAAAVQTPGARRNLARMLKQWQQDAEPIFAAAIDRSALTTLAEDMRAVLVPAPQVQLSGTGAQKWCSGHAGQPCRFAADGHGGRAQG